MSAPDLSYREQRDKLADRIRAHKEFANFDVADWIDGFLARRPRQHVLDLGCGDGNHFPLYLRHVGAGGTVTGLDFNPGMLAVARSATPPDAPIDWREASAEAMPLPDASFDVALCQMGLQFVPDKPAAVREMRRVLAPGGRLAVAAWRSLADLPQVRELNAVAERHVGPVADSRHSFGNADALRALLADGGFREVAVDILEHDVRFAGLNHLGGGSDGERARRTRRCYSHARSIQAEMVGNGFNGGDAFVKARGARPHDAAFHQVDEKLFAVE